MAEFLRTIGERAFDLRWWVIGAWVAILITLGTLAAVFYKEPSNAISIPGTEAQITLDRFTELFPDAGQSQGRVVFEVADGTIDEYKTRIEQVVADLAEVEGVSQVVSPFVDESAVSDDRAIAYGTIALSQSLDEIEAVTFDGVAGVAREARGEGLAVEVGGDVINQVPEEILGIGEVVGVVLALGVLLVTLGSLVAAGLPLIVALVTVGGGAAGLFALSEVIDITSTTPVLAIMLGLAVGIDYSLFIVNKYRHYLLHGYSYKDASGKAVATAGNAVIFAATTVVIALSALAIVQIPFMTSMGLTAAATVALAAIVAVTLLPALFGVTGTKIFRGKTKQRIAAAQKRGVKDTHQINHKTIWYRWATFLTKRPILTLVSLVAVVAVVAWPIRSLELGLPTDEYAATDTTQRKAYDILERGFGAGFNGPLLLLADNVASVNDEDRALVRQQLEAMFTAELERQTEEATIAFQQQLARAQSPEEFTALQQEAAAMQAQAAQAEAQARAELEGQIAQFSELYQLNLIAEQVAELDGVAQALPAMVTESGDTGFIQVIPTSGPSSSETEVLIAELRDPEVVQNVTGNGVSFGVTGSTALQVDIDEKLATALPQYLAVVVGLSFLLLMIVFRSILVPLKATLGFLLSVAAMFGALVAVFQWGWFGIADAPGPIVSFIPIIAIGILFGLAMDYEFFLVTSIREEFERTGKAKRAIVDGFAIGSRVVVAAAVIMVAVFAGFVTNHDATIQAMGFGLAIGILVDAFIVRLMIVPAVLSLLGRSAWWLPKWLDKLLPRVSIEGKE